MNRRGILMTYHIERDGAAVALEVRATVNLGLPANFAGHPDTWSPAEPDEVDYGLFLGGTIWDGELTADEEDALIDTIVSEVHDEEYSPDSDADDRHLYVDEELFVSDGATSDTVDQSDYEE